jgi:hypothetical protein
MNVKLAKYTIEAISKEHIDNDKEYSWRKLPFEEYN